MATTPATPPGRGAGGLFLVAPAPNLIREVLSPGYVVVFASDQTLRSAAKGAPAVRITAAGASGERGERGNVAISSFTVAGQRFDVLVPREAVSGLAAVLPWIVLGAGAGPRRPGSRARGHLGPASQGTGRPRPDLHSLARPDRGRRFRRTLHARQSGSRADARLHAGRVLGRPYLDLVHPDDRETTAAEAAAIGDGKATLSFENRYARKDGSHRVLEWTSTPVVEDGVMYGMARDVTERRRAEAEAKRLADEHAALRRVATLVAEGASPAAVLDAVAAEMEALLDADQVALNRFEPGDEIAVLAHRGLDVEQTPVGSRLSTEGESATAKVRRTGRPARMEDYESAGGALADLARATGLRSSVSAPITVEGRLWGLITASWKGEQPPPPGTEERMVKFAGLLDTAIANTDARREVERLAGEQATLRRVATLVAEGASPSRCLRRRRHRDGGPAGGRSRPRVPLRVGRQPDRARASGLERAERTGLVCG